MAVSYKKLFKLMIDRDIKKKDLKDMTGLSYGTIAKLEKGSNVEIGVLDKICVKLGCQLSDVAEIIFDEDDC
ncbi:helix-turn-helix domain-containing protein [Butyrivibrio sp. AE3009]|uniref:helix-turn-helix domain-containing protein n=1 Tax=Butyrivibrio sp. AE3009 TaxID=1280666 RepID=UPI0003B2F7E4|nr:helix-turn-helix transcriptional regulator [Butyrivibrio sp. AE3009]